MPRIDRDDLHALAVLAERAVQLEAGYLYFQRGAAYAQAGHVRGLRRSSGVLTARVRGTRRYRVMVDLADGLHHRCDCPLGEEGAFCKHCVATVLAWLSTIDATTVGA